MVSSHNRLLFLEAYEEYADAVFRHCLFRVSDREVAKDITQETFTRVWRYLKEGKEIRSLKSFLFRVANNLIVDQYRRKKSGSLDALREAGFDVSYDNGQSVESPAEVARAVAAISELKEAYQEVVTMRYVDNLTIEEIAEVLDERPNTVSVRLGRAVRKLRDLLQM